MAESSQELEWRLAQRLKSASIPPQFLQFTDWSELNVGPRMKKLVKLASAFDLDEALKTGRGIFVTGDPGIGKTTTLALVIRKYALEGRRVRYVTAAHYLKALRYRFSNRDDRSADIWVQRRRDAELLMLDDLGAEPKTDSEFGPSELVELIRGRRSRMLPTLITTNMSAVALSSRYGAVTQAYLTSEFDLVFARTPAKRTKGD